METTQQLYERAKVASGCATDYQFHKRFGVLTQTVSRWSHGKSSFDDDSAGLIAGILGVEPGYVMACANAERAKSAKSRASWARVAALLAAVVSTPTPGGQVDNNAGQSSFMRATVCQL